MYLLQRLIPTNVGENQQLKTVAMSPDLEEIKESFIKFVYNGTMPMDLIIVKQLPLAWNLQVTTENVQEWEVEEDE